MSKNAPGVGDEISRLIQVFKSFQDAFSDLGSINRYTDSLSAPIRKLPPEIVAQILSHALEPAKGPAFALVCRAWRDIVYSSPRLWNQIRLSTMILPGRSESCIPSMISHSGDIPLTLHIQRPDFQRLVDVDNPSLTSASLRASFHRLTYIELIDQHADFHFENTAAPYFPVLSKLHIWRPTDALVAFFNNSPNLDTLILSGLNEDTPLLSIASFHRVSSLMFLHCDMGMMISVLSTWRSTGLYPTLRILNSFGFTLTIMPGMMHLSTSNIKSLFLSDTLNDFEGDLVKEFLERFNVPELESLTLVGIKDKN
jgi:hypothetical protein